MSIDYTRLKEGDPVDAASLNDRFTDFETALNDIDLPAIERGGLTSEHLPSLMPDQFSTFAKAAPKIRNSQSIDITTIQGDGAIPGNLVQVSTAPNPHGFENGDRFDIAGGTSYDETAAGPVDLQTPTTFQYYTAGSSSSTLDGFGTVGGNVSYDRYNNSLALTLGAYPFDYQTFVGNPIGPGPSADTGGPGKRASSNAAETGGGWRILAYRSVGDNTARIDPLGSFRLDDIRIKGVLVRGSYELYNRRDLTPADTSRDPMRIAAIAIGWQDSTGVRHIVERSVRFYSTEAVKRGDLVTSTLLKQTDLDADGDGTVNTIFLAIAGGVRGDVATAETQQDLEVRYYNITTWPLHAGDL